MSFFLVFFLGIPNCCRSVLRFTSGCCEDLQTEKKNPTQEKTSGYTCLMMIIRLLLIHIAVTAGWVGKWLRQGASDQK